MGTNDEQTLKRILPGQPGNPYGRWKPGQSGNPNGRPISKPYKEALQRMLEAAAEKHGIAQERAHDLIAAAHVAKCMSGDMAAIKEYADRTDGKVPNPIGGTDELPPITAFSWREPDMTMIEDQSTTTESTEEPSAANHD